MNNDDFRNESDNKYPYSSYYEGNSYAYQDPDAQARRRRRRSRSAGFIILFVLVLAASSAWVFFGRYNVALDKNPNGSGWYFSITPEGGAQGTGSLPGGKSPSGGTAEASGDAAPAYAPTGDGTVLPLTALDESRQALTLQEIYKKVAPSVVGVVTTSTYSSGSGTGIIMSKDGYIITNYHVISGSRSISVELEDGTFYDAAVVGSDETSDLAVIKIDATDLVPAEFGNSDSLQVGDEVSAIGNPLGLELKGTLTNGIISAINRDIDVDGRTMTLIQTNAALNAGNSGGPLINGFGQVVGVNTMKLSSYYSSIEGLGFAIPISLAKPIIDELIDRGYVSGRPAIGITGCDVTERAAAYYRIPGGVLINYVDPASDAYAQGLQAGDIIVQINGIEVGSMDELNAVKNDFVAGETVSLTIYRNGELFTADVLLMDMSQVDG